jgi:hypothetical protein
MKQMKKKIINALILVSLCAFFLCLHRFMEWKHLEKRISDIVLSTKTYSSVKQKSLSLPNRINIEDYTNRYGDPIRERIVCCTSEEYRPHYIDANDSVLLSVPRTLRGDKSCYILILDWETPMLPYPLLSVYFVATDDHFQPIYEIYYHDDNDVSRLHSDCI